MGEWVGDGPGRKHPTGVNVCMKRDRFKIDSHHRYMLFDNKHVSGTYIAVNKNVLSVSLNK